MENVQGANVLPMFDFHLSYVAPGYISHYRNIRHPTISQIRLSAISYSPVDFACGHTNTETSFAIRRLPSTASFAFVNTGFYITFPTQYTKSIRLHPNQNTETNNLTTENWFCKCLTGRNTKSRRNSYRCFENDFYGIRVRRLSTLFLPLDKFFFLKDNKLV